MFPGDWETEFEITVFYRKARKGQNSAQTWNYQDQALIQEFSYYHL